MLHQSADRARLLIVDDDARLLVSLSELFEGAGYQVTLCGGGAEAIAAMGTASFDAVLLDLHMPRVGGAEVMGHIRASGVTLALVVMSGDADIDAAIAALRGGASDFVRKPCVPEQLLHAVGSAVEKLRLQRENRSMAQRLEQSEAWHRFLVDHSPDLIYILDAEGCFLFLSRSVERLLGYTWSELAGEHFSGLVHPADVEKAAIMFGERAGDGDGGREFELRLRTRHGQPAWLDVSTRFTAVTLSAGGPHPLGDGSGAFAGIYGVAKDLSERKKAEDMIYHQAYHDLLTGLPNRLLFKDHVALAIAQAKRNREMLAVMFLDLDRFKTVNDTHGHVLGDLLLQNVATRLSNCVREGDTLARIGGDEFTLLLPRVADRESVENTARKILSVMEAPFTLNEHLHCVSASIGIAMYPDDGDSMDTLIKNADIAMYEVKASGRNGIAFFSRSRHNVYSSRLSLEKELRSAIGERQIEVYYQPVVETESGRISGVEALARWNHPTRGLLLPADFIPLAEESALICPLGEWVLRTACMQARSWQSSGGGPIRLSVNLSAQQIDQDDFVMMVTAALRDSGLPPDLLALEVTETVMMKHIERSREKLKRVAEMGVHIAIDDFGTGYSSLSYLRSLPIHSIKIDQSFVRDMTEQGNPSIVTAMILIAKGLQLKLVAEGVETGAQLEFLRQHRCESYQGFFYSKPVPAEDMQRMLRSEREALSAVLMR